MKAEDLMIGDLVRQKYSGLILQVSEIHPPYILAECEEGQFHEDTIEPIPLTSEILEKNGFHDGMALVDDYYISEGIHYNIYSKNIILGYVYGGALEVKCEYVHELQHAFKLCGIEKDITL